MRLPVMPPVAPMLAKSVKTIPEGDYLSEPKWDGSLMPPGPDISVSTRRHGS